MPNNRQRQVQLCLHKSLLAPTVYDIEKTVVVVVVVVVVVYNIVVTSRNPISTGFLLFST